MSESVPHSDTMPEAQPLSAADLLDNLRRGGLLSEDQLAELGRQTWTDSRTLGRHLLQRDWLTPYQVNQLVQGHGKALVLGPSVLLSRLGAGGMGTVFKARHSKMDRIVALKVISPNRLTHPDAVRRFEREVRMAAQLDHPNIVHALDAGREGPTHFLVMEYVEGTDLAKHVKQHGPLAARVACDYVRQAAMGLQHAWERALVHRDIKPSNLLLATRPGADAVVKILDFGLARVEIAAPDAETTSTLTGEGAVMGTPDYVAPEQIRDTHHADIRADLYSLGCTLYFLLAGRPPFPGGTLGAKLLRHQTEEPEPLEKLRCDLPPGLPTVLSRLMAKSAEDRYQIPAEAADALDALLSGAELPAQPQAAPDPPSVPPSVSPFAHLESNTTLEPQPVPPPRRRRRLAVMATAAALVLVAAVVGVAVFWPRPPAPEPTGPPPGEFLTLDDLNPDDIPPVERFPWQPAKGLVAVFGSHRLHHLGIVYSLRWASDGQAVISCGDDATIRFWDPNTGRQQDNFPSRGGLWDVSASSDDRWLAATNYSVLLWKRVGRHYDGPIALKGPWQVGRVAVSPNGHTLAMSKVGGLFRVWDLEGEQPAELTQFTAHESNVRALVWSPDSETLYSAGEDGQVLVWQRRGGKWQRAAGPPRLQGKLQTLAISPDGKMLAAGGESMKIWLWDTGQWQDARASFKAHDGTINGLAFRPDGKLLASCATDKLVKVWDLTGDLRGSPAVLLGHTHHVNSVAFAPDGKTLASGGLDRTVRLWDATADGWTERFPQQWLTGAVAGLAFDANGSALLTVGGNPNVWSPILAYVWPLGKRPGETAPAPALLPESGLRAVTCSPQGDRLAITTYKSTWVCTLANGQVRTQTQFPNAPKPIECLALSPTEALLAGVGNSDQVCLWGFGGTAPTLLPPLDLGGSRSSAVAFSADGQLLAAGDSDGHIRLWQRKASRKWERQTDLTMGGPVSALAFAPDGRALAAGSSDGRLRLWPREGTDWQTDRILSEIGGGSVLPLAYAPDGKTLAASKSFGQLMCWETASWKSVYEWQSILRATALTFAPDGRHLAVGNENGTTYLLRLAAKPDG